MTSWHSPDFTEGGCTGCDGCSDCSPDDEDITTEVSAECTGCGADFPSVKAGRDHECQNTEGSR